MANNPLRTRLTDDFGLQVPIIAFTHSREVVAAVSNAGGLGMLGAGFDSDEKMEEDVRWIIDQVGGKPFGVNVLFPAAAPPRDQGEYERELRSQIPQRAWDWMQEQMKLHNVPPPTAASLANEQNAAGMGGMGDAEHIRQHVGTLIDLAPPVIAAGLGNPSWAVDAAHARGIKIISLIGNVRQAVRVKEGNVDYIVAQGTEAGGHTGVIGTFALVPQVVNAVSPTPVLTAGGVGTGKHLAAALAMGTEGVWTGSIWLATKESHLEPFLVERIIASSERDTVITSTGSGHPLRSMKSKWTDIWTQPGAPSWLPGHLQPLLTRDFQRSIRENNMKDYLTSPAGQIIGSVTEVKSCADVVYDIATEARQIIERFAAVAAAR